MATFEIGQIFEGVYPPEAAAFCNSRGDCFIKEIERQGSTRRFQITATPQPSLDELKEQKLAQLEQAFLAWYEKGATVKSSLGFTADSDARSMMDVSGLVTTLEATPEESRSTVAFMDSSNQPHALTLDQMKILQLEIIRNGQSAYQQKWALRTQIENAEDAEALERIEISFKAEDFSAKESSTLAKVGI